MPSKFSSAKNVAGPQLAVPTIGIEKSCAEAFTSPLAIVGLEPVRDIVLAARSIASKPSSEVAADDALRSGAMCAAGRYGPPFRAE